MTVFKNYFKIMYRYKGLILLYIGLCIGISLLNSTSATSAESYVEITPNIAIINHDSETNLIKGFRDYLKDKTKIIEIEDDEDTIQDELFYRNVRYVLIIPEDFSNKFLNGENINIDIKKTQDSYSTYTEMLINKYFNMANIYNKAGMNETNIVKSIKKDMEKESEIILQEEMETQTISKLIIFYNFANYAFLGIFIYIIATLMLVFNNKNIKNKNSISSTPYSKISNQIFLANLFFAFSIWILYFVIAYIMFGSIVYSPNGLLILLNSFVFSICAVTIGFLSGILVKSKDAISGIVNTVALGLSFISGCFVPQQWLSESVLNFSKLFPSYWYVNGNDLIANIVKYDFETLKPLFRNMGVLLLYTIGLLIVIAIINKKKK